MALTGTLVAASSQFANGTCSLQYAVELYDDTLGFVGSKGYTVTDPTVTAQVYAYVEQMLPTIAAQVGVPVILPPAPPAPVED